MQHQTQFIFHTESLISSTMGHVGQSCEAVWSPSAIRAPSTQAEGTCLDLSWGLGDTSRGQSRSTSHGAQGNTNTSSSLSSTSAPSSQPSSGGPGTNSSNWTPAATQACNEEWSLWKGLLNFAIRKCSYLCDLIIILVMFLSFPSVKDLSMTHSLQNL